MVFLCNFGPGWKSSQAKVISEEFVSVRKIANSKADYKPRVVTDDVYANGTWFMNGWVDKSNHPSSRKMGCGNKIEDVCTMTDKCGNSSPGRVGCGKNTVCMNKLGCACTRVDECSGPKKKIEDLLQGSYSCCTGWTKKRKRRWLWGTSWTTSPSGTGRARTTPMKRGRRRSLPNMGLENENPVQPETLNADQANDHIQGKIGGEQVLVHGGEGQDRVHDGEPVSQIMFKTIPGRVKPRDWKLVKKRGVVPDGLVQSKLNSFIKKFPNLEWGRGEKRNLTRSYSSLGGEGGKNASNVE